MMKRLLSAAALLALFATPALAASQFTVPSTGAVAAQNLNQGDLVPTAPLGVGQAATVFAPVGLVGSIGNESAQVPLTGFTITPNNNVTLLFLNPAGTLATGQITFPASPSDGEQFCWLSTHTQTAVTMAANTGQSLAGTSLTAGVANTWYCWRYIAVTTTWYRVQ